MNECEVKIGKIRNLLVQLNIDGVLLSKNDNFSWITCGGRGWVGKDTESSVASVLVTKDRVFLISNNIEIERLLREEVKKDIFEPVFYKWYEPQSSALERIIVGMKIASDIYMTGFKNIEKYIKPLRMVLTRWEIERAKKNGEEMERLLEDVVSSAKADMTEYELAASVEKAFTEKGFELPVLLVFSDESRNLYRHNLPRNKKLGRFFFVSVCARKGGIVLSMTRSAAFIEDKNILLQHKKNARIDAKIFTRTTEGKLLKEMFYIIRNIYKEEGALEEFEKHHQGGIGGYNSREEKAMPDSNTVLKKNMLIEWNPTITGTKSEDSFILGEKKYITFTKNSAWPSLTFNIDGIEVKRPAVKIL